MTDNLFSPENVISSDWMKFDTVGDIVKGTFVEAFDKAGEGAMPGQRVVTLTNATRGTSTIDGNEIKNPQMEEVGDINVGIKETNNYLLQRLKTAKEGDIIGFAFMKEIPATKKGYNPAKSIQIFKGGVDQDYLANKDNITVDSVGDIFE